MRNIIVLAALASISCAAPAARSTVEPPAQSPLSGEAPASAAIIPAPLVETAARAAGVDKVKIRIDDGGRLSKVAVYHGDAERIPQAVRDLAAEQFPDSKTMSYESEHYASRGDIFEVEVETKDGKRCEVAATPDGSVVYEECRLDPAGLPEPVKATIEGEVPGAKVLEAEEKHGPDVDELTVEVEKDGREHYLRIAASGELLAHYLRIPAILEVPAP